MLYTILQIVAFQALFLLVYDLFLKRETFFNYNRAYLLITSVLSLVLPFIKLPKLQKIANNDLVIQLPEVFIGAKAPTEYEILVAEQVGIVIEQPQMPLWQTILFAGIALASLIFLFKMVKLYWLKHKNPKRWQGHILIVHLIKSSAAFSFFNTIFMGERIPETEKPTIYKHELVHIEERHSLDLLYFELLRIAMWFSPLVYLYQSRIKELHEYIADSKAVKQNGKADYYQSLLNQVFDVNTMSFTNTFFKKSLIKKRIAMLQKSKSKQLNLVKYALLVPIVFGMLIYTSTEVRAQQIGEVKQEVNQELTDKELQKKYYDEIVKMDKNGATFFELADFAGVNTKKKSYEYIRSRQEFLKFKAYMQYISDQGLKRKSDKGTLTDYHIERAKSLTEARHKTYADYRAWLDTDEAKERWEASARDGELKLFVSDASNMTKDEQNRYDRFKNQLFRDDNFDTFIMTDGKSTLVLTDPEREGQIKENKGVVEILEVEDAIEVPFSVIDEVPTSKDCESLSTNEERKKCLSDFISKHINKNFNTDLADSLNLNGRQRIFVSFKMDKEGKVKSIGARAAHPGLEDEAKRVIKTLPQFVPGKHKGKVVTVPYSLPIVFQVNNNVSAESYGKRDTLSPNRKQLQKYLNEAINRVDQDSTAISFSRVETVPAFEDCELFTDNDERKKCTSNSINSFVNKNFNTDVATKIGATGRQRIFISFRIDEQGYIKDVKSRAAHPEFEAEANRVINALPKFSPGKHKEEFVEVAYALPIVFQVSGPSSLQNDTVDEENKEKWHKENPNATTIPFLYLDELPILSECKNFSKANQKSCFVLFTQEHVTANFNKDIALKNNLKGKQRILVTFIIDKKGNIKEAKSRASHPALEIEAKRVVGLLPTMIPGKYNGKIVETNYSLPIVFEVSEPKKD